MSHFIYSDQFHPSVLLCFKYFVRLRECHVDMSRMALRISLLSNYKNSQKQNNTTEVTELKSPLEF